MEKIDLLDEKIRKAINLIHRLREENRHLKEELALQEEINRKAKKILKENETYKGKINQIKEKLTKLLEKFEKYKI